MATQVGSITLDGMLSDWTPDDRADRPATAAAGIDIYGRVIDGKYVFAISAADTIAAGSSIFLNTDRNATTGGTGGAEYSIQFNIELGVIKPFLFFGDAYAGPLEFSYSPDGKSVEFFVPLATLNDDGNTDWAALINGKYIPSDFSLYSNSLLIDIPAQTFGAITLDGNLADWAGKTPIADGASGQIYVTDATTHYVFAIKAPVALDAGTTIKLNMDRSISTGDVNGNDYTIKIGPNLVPLLVDHAGAVIAHAYSSDQGVLEFSVAKSDLMASVAFDVTVAENYTNTPVGSGTYRDAVPVATDSDHRIGIVYSQTTAQGYFGLSPEQNITAYTQLILAAQNQAMMAGIPFDLLSEVDLTNVEKLSHYDTLVFPSFSRVPLNYLAIADTLKQASDLHGVGIVTAGNFMTNAADGGALPGDSYAIMKSLLGIERLTTSPQVSVNIALEASATAPLQGYVANEAIATYSNIGTSYFGAVNGNGVTLVDQNVGGVDHAAVISTQTGGHNVHFATESFLGDNNLLWQAMDLSSQGNAPSLSLSMSRETSLFASRTDMDQAQEIFDVQPENNVPGIYDALVPILEQWKAAFNFVGSYYVDIGSGTAEQYTDWTKAETLYKLIMEMGNEIGSHSVTHPANTNSLTPAQIKAEFETSRATLIQYLGPSVTGAAVPGAAESITTTREIIKYYDYITGGWTGVGAGYPGAFGFLSPGEMDKVYLAPNVTFDFTLVGFQKLTAAQAEIAWKAEWDKLVSHTATPIVVWPWHDYGPTNWLLDEGPTTTPPYTQDMFTNFIKRAYDNGSEFVTLQDLAARIESFQKSQFNYSVSGDQITATVSATSGKFDLDLSSHTIQNVANWYAYDKDSVFLTPTGGTFVINTGVAEDDVTHISKLPMRAELSSITGDGTSVSFSVVGEGVVEISLRAGATYVVAIDNGAAVTTPFADIIKISLTGLGAHNVVVTGTPIPPVYSLSAGASTVAEGGELSFTVTRDNSLVATAVDLVLAGSATAGGDYITPATTVSFLAGELSKTIRIAALEDIKIDPAETIVVSLGSPSSGSITNDPAHSALTLTINDVPQVYSVALPVSSVAEGGALSFVLERTLSSMASDVSFTIGGTGASLVTASTPLAHFDIGQTTTTLKIQSVDNAVDGPDLSVSLTLAGSSDYNIKDGFNSASGTILDNDAPATGGGTGGGGGSTGGGSTGGGGSPQPGQGPSVSIEGTAGSDHFTDTADNETFEGGDGLDYVSYSGNRADYNVVVEGGMPVSISGPFSNDQFSGIERLKFADGVVAFDDVAAQSYRLYEAAFDRSPDIAGLTYWTEQLDLGARDLVSMALDFLYSPEFNGLFGDFKTLSDQQTVEILYRNILDRDGEKVGIDYWVEQLQTGTSREHLLAFFSESAENKLGTDPQLIGGVHLESSIFN